VLVFTVYFQLRTMVDEKDWHPGTPVSLLEDMRVICKQTYSRACEKMGIRTASRLQLSRQPFVSTLCSHRQPHSHRTTFC